MKNLTPRELVAELDKYIVGQDDAKRAVAVAVRNRWRRTQLTDDDMRAESTGKNIIMIGPTGVGKTEIARRLAGLTGAPFIKVEATKYTEVGYHGRDVESMVRDLLDNAIALVREELTSEVREPAEASANERIIDQLLGNFESPSDDTDTISRKERTRDKLREQLKAGQLEDREIELSVEHRATAVAMLGKQGMEMDIELQSMFEKMIPSKRETRKLNVRDARKVLIGEEADKRMDKDKITRLAIDRAEQEGIIFLDEIDKIAGTDKQSGPDVSRQGVQRDLLPIVEGSTVITKYGPMKTDHVLFIAAGAFHSSKPSDLMPELQGRFPIRVELQDLTKDDFVRILHEPRNSLTKQTIALLGTEGVEVTFTDDSIAAMAQIAYDVNRTMQNIGARRLYTILEKVFEKISFNAPELAEKKVTIDAKYVTEQLGDVVKDEDLSKFIL